MGTKKSKKDTSSIEEKADQVDAPHYYELDSCAHTVCAVQAFYAHQLKAPVASLRGLINVLQISYKNDEQEVIKRMEDTIEKIEKSINNWASFCEKNKMLLLFLLCILSFQTIAQSSKVEESVSFRSAVLKSDWKYSVYLPPQYFQGSRKFPVLYLLHGYNGDETEWLKYGNLQEIMDEGIKNGSIYPMVVVLPSGSKYFFMNTFDGKYKYEDAMIQELVPHIESKFRVISHSSQRAISGLSMGGYGALYHALKRPGVFGICAVSGAGVIDENTWTTMDTAMYNTYHAPVMGAYNTLGNARFTEFYQKNAVLSMVKNNALDSLKKVTWYIDCGDDDFLSTGNAQLHMFLKSRKVPHEYRVSNGGHNMTYWNSVFPGIFSFISKKFARQ